MAQRRLASSAAIEEKTWVTVETSFSNTLSENEFACMGNKESHLLHFSQLTFGKTSTNPLLGLRKVFQVLKYINKFFVGTSG